DVSYNRRAEIRQRRAFGLSFDRVTQLRCCDEFRRAEILGDVVVGTLERLFQGEQGGDGFVELLPLCRRNRGEWDGRLEFHRQLMDLAPTDDYPFFGLRDEPLPSVDPKSFLWTEIVDHFDAPAISARRFRSSSDPVFPG